MTKSRRVGGYRPLSPATVLTPVRRTLAGTRVSRALAGGPVLPITFPTTALRSRVRIALGADLSADPLTWAWEDITTKVRWDEGVSLTVGRRDEGSVVETGRGQMKLDNRDARFTRRNPTGPYYGLLSKNTPVWGEVDAGSGWKTRMEMFVNEWPKTWADKSATDSTVTIRCAGVLRRLAQGSRVLRSALRRSIERNATVLSYWPLEDGSDATQAASGVIGGNPLILTGSSVPAFAAATGPAGSGSVLSLTQGGVLRGRSNVPATSPAAMRVQFLIKYEVGTSAAGVYEAVRWTTLGGSYTTWAFGVLGTNQMYISYSGAAFETLSSIFSAGTVFDGQWHRIEVTQRYNEFTGNLIIVLNIDGAAHATGPFSGGAGETFGNVDVVTVNAFDVSGSQMPSLGHITVLPVDLDFSDPDPLGADPAMNGYAGEQAHNRIRRLCSEEGVVYESVASTSPAMGPQGTGTLLALLRDAEAVGGGVLYEKRWGLMYQSIAERYNAPVAFALDIAQGHLTEIPEPADDDQRTRNRITVSRPNGSSYVAERTTGPMGTGPEGPGVYDDAVSVNVETDAQLASQAGWRLHL